MNRLREFQNHISNDLLPCASSVVSMYVDDDLLQAISECQILPPLSKEEKSFIKQKYEEFLTIFDKRKNSEIGRYRFAFPGCGDKKKDENDDRIKESDMVIYHEMLKYIKEKCQDAVFLTFDLKKGDWVPCKGHNDVFLHYIENQFCQTGHVIYVKSGDELPLLFSIPSASVEDDTDNDEPNIINQGSITLFGDNFTAEDEYNEEIECTNVVSEHDVSLCHKNYRKIDSKRFLSELQTCSKWASEYGAGYVGRDYFIYGLLGKQKHFEFNQSRLVYKSLIESGKIKEEVDKDGDAIIIMKS